MTAEYGGRVIATARYCKHAADDRPEAWAVSGWADRLFTRRTARRRLLTVQSSSLLDCLMFELFDMRLDFYKILVEIDLAAPDTQD